MPVLASSCRVALVVAGVGFGVAVVRGSARAGDPTGGADPAAGPAAETPGVEASAAGAARSAGEAVGEPGVRDEAAPRWREQARVRGTTLDDQPYRERRHILSNTWSGAVGGLRVADAGSAAPRSYRVLLGFSANGARGWLAPDAPHRQTGMVLAISTTPAPWLEVYGTTTAWRSSDYSVDRAYFQVLGDTSIGAKASRALTPWATIGGDAGIRVPLNTVRGLKPLVVSTSAHLRANASVDLRDHPIELPLMFRLNMGYQLNNDARMLDRLEGDRYQALPPDLDPPSRPIAGEDRHRIDRIERTAMRIDRTDRAVVGFGVEAPIAVRPLRSVVAPIGEWVIDVPVNRQGFACPTGGPSAGVDGCGAATGLRGHRQALLVGARINPYFYGLSAFAAAEVGVAGLSPDLAFQTPLPPVRFLFGFSFAQDQLYRPKK